MADYREQGRAIMERIKARRASRTYYTPPPPSAEGLSQLNAAFAAEFYQDPEPVAEHILRTWAYRVLAEEFDRRHTSLRDYGGDASLHRCHPAIRRVCLRHARNLAAQLQPDNGVPWTSHGDMLQQLDATCPDWRTRVQDRRPLVGP